jgi:hypothetical protein
MKQADPRNMFKKACNSECTSTAVLSPGPLFSILLNSLALKSPENIEEDPDDPGTATEGDIQLEFSSD